MMDALSSCLPASSAFWPNPTGETPKSGDLYQMAWLSHTIPTFLGPWGVAAEPASMLSSSPSPAPLLSSSNERRISLRLCV